VWIVADDLQTNDLRNAFFCVGLLDVSVSSSKSESRVPGHRID